LSTVLFYLPPFYLRHRFVTALCLASSLITTCSPGFTSLSPCALLFHTAFLWFLLWTSKYSTASAFHLCQCRLSPRRVLISLL
jgi:hypothetical protein